MPKLSVIIPVYNVEKYIEKCIRSLFEQTLDDIEYIFINDCTPDRSIEILLKVLEEYPNRKNQVIIENMSTNSGQALVRKHGFQIATGEYIIHCDSDDWLDIHTYEKLYNIAKENNSDIVFCDFYLSDGINNQLKSKKITELSKEKIIYSIIQKGYWHLWSALVKREIFNNNYIIYPTANNGEDFALIFQFLFYANKFTYIPFPLYYYRYNPNSITNSISEQNYLNRLEQHIQNVNLLENFYIKNNAVSIEIYKLILIILKLNARYLISYLAHNKKYKIIWQNTFPELENERIIFNKSIPFYLKKNYLATKFNLYNFLRKCKKNLTKINL